MTVELLNHTLNPDETIEKAARICYNSKSGDLLKRKKFLQFRLLIILAEFRRNLSFLMKLTRINLS